MSFSLQTSHTLSPTAKVAAVLLLLGASSMELKQTNHWSLPSTQLGLAAHAGLCATHIRQFTLLLVQERPQQQYQLYRRIPKLLIPPTINIFCRLLGTIIIKIHVENECNVTDHSGWPTKLL